MKHIFLISIIILVFFSCSPDEETQTPTQYTLTMTAGDGGSVTGGGTFDEGTEVTVTAIPQEGYEFVSWSDANTDATRIVLVNSTITTIAFFKSKFFDFESQYANISDHGYATGGIFTIWWDNKYDMLSEAKIMLEDLKVIRQKSLDLGMGDPPNVTRGVFTNIYLHTGSTIGDAWSDRGWGAGVGTNAYGVPYMTVGKNTARELSSLFHHEGFHIFQYNRNSFPYSGDTAWYIETSASWFTIVNLMETRPDIDFFVGARTLPLNPQLALWHSFGNRATGDPVDWLYEVRQYALEAYLYYLTEVEGFDSKYITNGFNSNITISPQEYLLQKGGAQYRNYFANWAAANTADLNYLTRDQVARAEKEADDYGNLEYRNEYAIEINANELNSPYSPPEKLKPRSWAYNVVKISNSGGNTYNLNFIGEENGSEGTNSFFEIRIVKKAGENNYTTTNFEIENGLTGNKTVTLNENEDEFYIVVVSVPEYFSGNQNYNYSISISE